MSVCPVFAGGGEGQGSSVLLQKDPRAMKIWSFLKLLGDFRDFLEEVTHFVSKIPVRIYCWAGRKMGTKFIEKGVRGLEKVF